MPDVSGKYLTLIGTLIPKTAWSAETGCFNGAAKVGTIPVSGPKTGRPVPSQTTDLALRGHGEQDPDQPLTVRVRRSGVPGPDRAAVVFNDTTNGYHGSDPPPCRPHNYGPLSVSGTASSPAVAALPDGTLLYAWYDSAIGTVTRSRSKTGTLAAAVTEDGYAAIDTHPALMVVSRGNDSFRVWLYHWRTVGTSTWIMGSYSDDSGATWSTEERVIPRALPAATYSTFEHILAVHNEDTGQSLLLAGTDTVAGPSQLCHWASPDGGHNYERISYSTPLQAQYFGLCLFNGLFYLAAASITWIVASVGSAFATFGNAAAPSAANQPTFTGAAVWAPSVALWAADDGLMWLAGIDATTGAHFAICTKDGVTWRSTGISARGDVQSWWDSADPVPATPTAPYWIAAAPYRGGAEMVFECVIALVSQGIVSCLTLGGWDTLSMPHFEGTIEPDARTAWERSYLPVDVCNSYPAWLTPNARWIASESVATGVLLVMPVGSGANCPWAIVSTIARGAMAEIEINTPLGAGAVQARLRLAPAAVAGADDVEIRISSVDIVLYDNNAGAIIGTYPVAALSRRILLAVAGNACRLAVQDLDHTPLSQWTTLYQGGVAPGAVITAIGVIEVPDGAAVTIRGFRCTEGIYTGDQLAGAKTWRDRNPRAILTTPVYLAYDASISAVSGPGAVADDYVVTPDADYSLSRLDPLVAPSPRWPTRIPIASLPAGTDSIRLSYEFDSADAMTLSPCLIVGLRGLNFPGAKLYVYHDAAWDLVGTVPTETFSGTRTGNTWVTAPAGTSGSYLWGRNELAGWGCSVINSVTGLVSLTTTVLNNREGSTTVNAATTPLILTLASSAGLGANDTILCLWPRNPTLVVNLGGYDRSIRGFQLKIPHLPVTTAPGRPSQGYYEIPILFVGNGMSVPRCSFSHVREISPGVELIEARDGTDSVEEISPEAQSYEMSWTGLPAPISALPSFLTMATSGAPLGHAYDPEVLAGQFDMSRGPLYPVIAIPSAPRTSTSSWMLTRRQIALYSRVTEKISLQAETGEEGRSDVQSVTTWRFKEIV